MTTKNIVVRVAEAIDLIHSVRFVAGVKTEDSELAPVLAAVQSVPMAVHLRHFQKRGISSTVVAKALRAGVLVAIPAGGK